MKLLQASYIFSILFATIISGNSSLLPSPNFVGSTKNALDSSQVLKEQAKTFYTKGEWDKAISFFKESYRLDTQLNKNNSYFAGENLVYIALAYYYKWEIDSSLYYLDKTKKIYLDNIYHKPDKLGYFYLSAGKIYLSTGDQVEAESDLLMAERILSKLSGEPYDAQLASTYLQLGYLYQKEGDYENSLKYLQKSYNKIVKIQNNNKLMINYYMRASMTHSSMGDYGKSISLQKLALDLCLTDSVHNIYTLGLTYNNLGLDYLNNGNLNDAYSSFKKSLNIYVSNQIKGIYLANLYNSLGQLYEKKSDYFTALKWHQKALRLLTTNFDSRDDIENPKPEQITSELEALEMLKSKSECLNKIYSMKRDMKYLDGAIQTAFLAIRVIENLRNSFLTYESKLQISAHEDFMYKYALILTNQAFKATGEVKYARQAFRISEESKSAVLLSSLRELTARKIANIPDSLLNKEKSLNHKIAALKSNIYEENQLEDSDTAKIRSWEENLLQCQQEYERLVHYYEITFPNYYSLKYDNSVVSVNDFQSSIPKDTKVLEYALTDSVLITFTITRNHFEMTSIKIDSSFNGLVNDYLKEFRQFDFSKQYYTHFTEFCWNSNRLYNTLIKPSTNKFEHHNLLIIPDGILSFLPYETFITEIPDSIPKGYYRELHYLLKDHAVSYAYSATFLDQVSRHRNTGRKRGLLAFAPDYSENGEVSINQRFTTRQKKYRKDLFPIPGVKEEVNGIAKLMNSKVYLGNNATETNFKKVAGKYDILHLAMHTIIDNRNPMYSKLIFSLTDDSLNDGLLNTHEIYGLKLNARLVVLSACSTGEGDYSRGEGVISLARGFVYAGTPSLVMSMWEVEDKSTVSLMEYFYKNLLKGESKSEALREAKLKFLNSAKAENSHPFFWSAFVLMGNPDPLYDSHTLIIIITIVATVVIMALIIFFVYRKRRAKSAFFVPLVSDSQDQI